MPLTPKLSTAFVLLTGAVCMAATGCHHAFACRRMLSDQWQLDQDRYVRLLHDIWSFPEWADPELTQSELSLKVCTGDAVVYQCVIDRRDVDERRRNGPIPVGDYEARADESRQRLWIVDRKTNRIIATHHFIHR